MTSRRTGKTQFVHRGQTLLSRGSQFRNYFTSLLIPFHTMPAQRYHKVPKKPKKKKAKNKKTHAFYIRLHEQQHNMHRICAASPSLLRRIVSFAFHVLPLHCFFEAQGPQGPLVFPHRPLRSIVPARLLASALPRIIIAKQQYQLIWHAMRESLSRKTRRGCRRRRRTRTLGRTFFLPLLLPWAQSLPRFCLPSAQAFPTLWQNLGRG